ncbi:hypothetical protein [Parabacteroides chinchillae]|uniref:Uncharacterized protein n=1 Tax=Parabacteroides chinchillae TaxID=871327 RepID=A0A8G2F9L8_9BACT|nr:hypothetical protein [Parabacteroides chinchillae]SEF52957.1 hypothetical protein SAMN05444001_102103 [Parabacteroides chinchillae]
MGFDFFRKLKMHIWQLVSRKGKNDHQKGNGCYQKTIYFLLKNQSPIGKAKSKRHPEIRIIKVSSFTDAYLFFLRMCDQRLLETRKAADYLYYSVTFPNGKGYIELSDKVGNIHKNTVAILKVKIPDLKPIFSEIRFITT